MLLDKKSIIMLLNGEHILFQLCLKVTRTTKQCWWSLETNFGAWSFIQEHDHE